MINARLAADLHEGEYRLVVRNDVLACIPEPGLRELVRRSSLVLLDARDALFAQGDRGSTVLVVLQGFIKLSATTPGGRETILDVAGPGDIFGELAVLNGWPRSTDAMALSACRLLSLDGKDFIQEMQRKSESLFALIRLLSSRLRVTTARMTDAVELSVPARIVKALKYLAALHSRSDEHGLHLELQLSQSELGGLTGLTRESINKYLGLFRDAGAIRMLGQDITIVDIGKLQQDHLWG